MPKRRKQRGKKQSSKQNPGTDEVQDQVDNQIPSKTAEEGFEESGYKVNPYTNEPVQPFLGALDPEEEKYFQEAEKAFVSHFTRDNEETRYFIDSVYREVKGKELIVLNNVFGSKVLEHMFPLATPSQIKSIFSSLNGHYLEITQTTFGSYAFEKLLSHMAEIVDLECRGALDNEEEMLEGEDQVFITAESLVMFMCNEIRPDFSVLINHKLAVHVLHKILMLLDGYRFIYTEGRRESMVRIRVPETFPQFAHSIIDSAVENLSASELRNYCVDRYASKIMQAFVRIDFERAQSGKKKKAAPLADKLLLSPDNNLKELPFLDTLLKDEAASRILEIIVEKMPSSQIPRFREAFEGRFYRLCVHPIANFVMQQYIMRLPLEELGYVVQELKQGSDNVVRKSSLAVLKTLLQRCNTLQAHQHELASLIFASAVDEGKKQNIIPTLLRSKHKRDVNDADKKRKLVNNMLGAQLLEEFLNGPKEYIQVILDNILELPREQLLEYCQETVSSHLIEKILDWPDLDFVFRKKFLNMFSGAIVELSVSAPGSHIVDKLWKASLGLPLYRTRIVQELAQGGDEIKFDFYGKKVWSNWKVELFRRAPDEWYRFMKQDEPVKRVHEKARSMPSTSANAQPLRKRPNMEESTSETDKRVRA
ncbi:RNA-binding protein Nop9 [Schizosaccharomyces cryophilus OY26]|uniref:Nucleolar protein 9 n=1 Tax=Schizosaccharomyces cryophilus (strain OY26 / ATCC MYA-4695 / CBS 11777 / NBRC 106824 / NRRL Y48691) TaxID=653667 RepID=S9W2A6_SCHCR|nr:RNA-binding protein Nop9 [Schizosaccharomyces cryophilus OY26]EPY52165.1 RNA-binding protein Nop9 [Schizosaccharomyces cryophilus OY26]